jgi:hypothetical protein
MSKSQSDAVPQVVSIAPVDSNGKIRLRKEVREYLGSDKALRLTMDGEVMLTARGSGDQAPVKGGRLALPQSVLQTLDASSGTRIALVARGRALAIKTLEIEEQAAEEARAVDRETRYRIVRTVETNAMPEELVPVLAARYRKRVLGHDVMAFLSGRRSLEAWMARRLLDKQDVDDEGLRKALVEERLREQQEDGSWGHDPMLTARSLRELSELGLTRRSPAVRNGAEWLLARAESEANPGMFFLSDRLVAKQADILMKRKAVLDGKAKGPLGSLRFAGRTPPEARRLLAADDIIERSCGTRIMWPNALALEALLGLRYEDHPRVRRALASLMHGYVYWCECNYQIRAGTHSWRPLPGAKELTAREQDCMSQYRYGGFSSLEQHLEMKRVARLPKEGKDVFLLEMRDHIQPCEVITTRALRHVRASRVRRAAAAHLWRFASVQQPHDGQFPQEEYCPSQAHMLGVFAYYDHPASRVAIMRSIPWIIDNQHPDGSWGEGHRKDASTLAVLRALLRVRDSLPAVLGP